MPMSKAAKHALKDDISGRFQKANAAVIAEYRGLTVGALTELRVKLRAANAEFKVVKNRVAKVSIDEDAKHAESLKDSLKGPTGIIFMYGDAAQATKSLLEFEKDRKENFKVTSGLMEGRKLSAADLKALADLPSKDVLLARIIGTLVSPHKGIMGVLKGVPRQLVYVINAIKEKKA